MLAKLWNLLPAGLRKFVESQSNHSTVFMIAIFVLNAHIGARLLGTSLFDLLTDMNGLITVGLAVYASVGKFANSDAPTTTVVGVPAGSTVLTPAVDGTTALTPAQQQALDTTIANALEPVVVTKAEDVGEKKTL